MLDECKSVLTWVSCLNCKLLPTNVCPLEGDDSVDRIVNRIRMTEDPDYNGYKEHIKNSR